MFSRKPRDMNKLMQDPRFPYNVGRLMGAAEMSAHWMRLREDAEAQEMGIKLAAIVDWFFEGEEDGKPTSDSQP